MPSSKFSRQKSINCFLNNPYRLHFFTTSVFYYTSPMSGLLFLKMQSTPIFLSQRNAALYLQKCDRLSPKCCPASSKCGRFCSKCSRFCSKCSPVSSKCRRFFKTPPFFENVAVMPKCGH